MSQTRFRKKPKFNLFFKPSLSEMIVSGYKGWKRRLERRKEEGGEKYRSTAGSLKSRSRKKLTDKEDWFKN